MGILLFLKETNILKFWLKISYMLNYNSTN